jgi:hypothetical protein
MANVKAAMEYAASLDREAREKRLSESDLKSPTLIDVVAKFKTAIHKFVSPDKYDGKNWTYKTDPREVEVLAVADGYAMVRRKGCAPYICQAKEIKEKNA